MAVTDPEARPHQRASMFLVDVDTPGVDVIRDIGIMEHSDVSFGRYGSHAAVTADD